jgi:aspartate aminotransferase
MTDTADQNPISFARRVTALTPSSIFRIGARASSLVKKGQDIVRLDAGEPDFGTPRFIIDAAHRALDEGFTRYTPIDGLPVLKSAIRDKLRKENNLNYQDNEVMHTCGAKQALFNACLALLEPSDEIIIPSPHWGTYPAIAKIAGAQIVEAATSFHEGFALTAETLKRCLSERTRVLILNSPNNPTGRVYSRETLAALGEVLLEYPKVVVLSDDIYEHIRFDNAPFINILNVCPSLRHRTLVINGVSKAYAMTGWRVGFAAGPADIIAKMCQLQGQTNSHTSAVSQVAAATALNGGLDEVHKMARIFASRAEQVIRGLGDMASLSFQPPHGGFYCFPDFSGIIQSLDGVENDQQMADWLLDELGVAMVPGSAFNASGFMRLSFAASEQTLEKGLKRLKQAFG